MYLGIKQYLLSCYYVDYKAEYVLGVGELDLRFTVTTLLFNTPSLVVVVDCGAWCKQKKTYSIPLKQLKISLHIQNIPNMFKLFFQNNRIFLSLLFIILYFIIFFICLGGGEQSTSAPVSVC